MKSAIISPDGRYTGFALVGTTKSFGPSFQSIMLVKTNRSLTTTNVVTINVGELRGIHLHLKMFIRIHSEIR